MKTTRQIKKRKARKQKTNVNNQTTQPPSPNDPFSRRRQAQRTLGGAAGDGDRASKREDTPSALDLACPLALFNPSDEAHSLWIVSLWFIHFCPHERSLGRLSGARLRGHYSGVSAPRQHGGPSVVSVPAVVALCHLFWPSCVTQPSERWPFARRPSGSIS